LMPLATADEEPPPSEKLSARVREATALGLEVPDELLRFLSDEAFYGRVPSCTACYFDIGTVLLPVPGDNGPARLLRFMNDQQTCFLWYVLLEPNAPHRVVVASPNWGDDDDDGDIGDQEGKSFDESFAIDEPAICADSFEEFIKRFWIENTLWWWAHKGFPALEGELKAYLDAVARTRR
jgi:hypothetical protein